jgi:ADP-ribosyl-[dinitrogen reductase] hydrolase
MTQSNVVGSILGTAVGDAIGLPYEGLSPRRAARLLGSPDRHRLFFGRGMVSDDTEHTCMVAQALVAAGGDVDVFRARFGWALRWWMLALPAGVGMATLRAIARLWAGFSPARSGVFSAGNGPAMRAAVIGAAIEDRAELRTFVQASSRITHTDPKAEFAAFAIALAARMACEHTTVDGATYRAELSGALGAGAAELVGLVDRAIASVARGESTPEFAASIGLAKGVSAYAYHSVPVAIHAWLRHQGDYRSAVMATVMCGVDADSTAAMVGGIAGAAIGKAGIPTAWLDRIAEWPRTVAWMERLGEQLTAQSRTRHAARPTALPALAILPRNAFFLVVVLAHGFRRLLPPY